MNILCMFSGGLDSTGALYSLLTQSEYKDYNIHVHSMDLSNIENRSGAEFQATMNIKKWFIDKGYKFKFTRSVHEYKFMSNCFIWDSDICAFMAGQITRCSPRSYNYIVMGRTKTDDDMNHSNMTGRIKRAREIFHASYGESSKQKPEYLYPVIDMTKQDIWDMLPEELRNYTWSCRTPKQNNKFDWVTCGSCITCNDIKKYIRSD